MASIGGKHSRYEKQIDIELKKLTAKVKKHTDRISSILSRAYSTLDPSKAYWINVERQVDIEYKALNKLFRTWMSRSTSSMYKFAIKELMTRLNRSKTIASRARKTSNQLASTTKSKSIVNILYQDAISDWVNSLNAGNSNIKKLLRSTQQQIVKESLINEKVAEAIASGNPMNATYYNSRNLSNTLAGTLKNASTIINDKAYVIAGSRKFKPNYYAEMVVRSKFHEAQAYAAMQTCSNYGTSLVQVSAHNTTTAVCIPYEGKVFSINGQDKRFPQLTEIPPFHPNCLHLLYPMFDTSMEVDGTINDWISFSNGDASTPPNSKSFIPVSERTA